EVVDAPPDVPRPRAGLELPPRVVPRLLVEESEGVVVAVGDQLRHPFALDGQEARRPLVLLRPREVDLGVRRVDVAADHHALAAPPQGLREAEELVIELELVGKPLRPHPAVGEVDVQEVEGGEFRVHDPSLAVERGRAELDAGADRLGPRIGDDAAIALLLGHAPVGPVTVGLAHLVADLVFLDLRLLHAEEIGALRCHEVEEALLPRGAQAVDIPRDELHPSSASRMPSDRARRRSPGLLACRSPRVEAGTPSPGPPLRFISRARSSPRRIHSTAPSRWSTGAPRTAGRRCPYR